MTKEIKDSIRTKNFVIRVSEEEQKEIKELAKEMRLSVSSFMRLKTLGKI